MKKWLVRIMLGWVALLLSASLTAAEVTNGYSGYTTITSVNSFWEHTNFVVAAGSNCGGVPGWRFDTPVVEDNYTRMRQQKFSMLFAAYLAGKTVYLRCENSRLTDFTIND